jgi:glycine dehydrogenase subunit 1
VTDEPVTQHPYLALTDDDRDEMLRTVGVASIDELFRDIPAGVRLGRELDLEPALSEQELSAHLGELAARNVDTTRELSFLGCGVYDHYVPGVVDAVLQRGEFLTAYTPYQPEMSQGVLQSIFEYQTAICELTGMDVSNASGYDGTTVTADACFIAKHATGRSKIIVTEATNPQVRQVVKTYAPGFGLEIVEVAQRGGTTDPDEVAAAAVDAAAVIFQTPNVFGCLEPAPELAAAANEAGALPIAHVDPLSLGVLEAPGRYGCAIALGEGQAAGNFPSYGGPHYGFLAARQDYIRRMPGRIVGETVDAAGKRGYVLTLQTREQHIRREKATSNITTNQTLLALGGLVYLSWLGPQGLRDVGEACLELSAYAKQQLTDRAGLELLFADRTTFKEFAVRVGRSAHDVVRAARERGVHPGYAIGRDYEGLDDVLLVAVTEKRTPAEIDRLAEVLAEVAGA